jgi:uncharacterized protein involved in exopolysaccharide biosynthesis
LDKQEGLSPERILRAVLARPKTFVTSVMAFGFAFGGAAAAVPPSYKATVVMTIDPGRYPNDFLRPNVIPGLGTRLGGMERMLESAPVIEEMRNKTGLAAMDSPGGGILEALGLGSDPVDSWRKSFRFEVPVDVAQSPNKPADTAPLVEMTFKSSDPVIAARIVNECAKRANDENNRFRRAFVEEVVRFIQKSQDRAREVTQKRDEAFNAFKLANMDKLPEQEAFLAGKLGQLRIRYSDLKQSERFAEARLEQLNAERGLLVAQIALNVQLAVGGTGNGDDGRDTPRELRAERLRLVQEVERRQDEYELLLTRNTPSEPTTRGAKLLLDRAKERLAGVESQLRLLGLLPREPGEGAVPVKPQEQGADRSSRRRPLVNDPIPPKKGIPNAPLNERLEHSGELKKTQDDAKKDRPILPTFIAQAGVVAVLSSETIDEKVLERSLDEMSYRLVVSNPGYGRVRAIDFAVKETKEALKELVRQREECFADTKKTEEQLGAIPEVRQRLETLARDLIEARDDHRRLADQLDNAKKALEVENEGKGEQFRVIDFARPPTKPTGPARALLVALALALALGAATGACTLLDLHARGSLRLLSEQPVEQPRRKGAA